MGWSSKKSCTAKRCLKKQMSGKSIHVQVYVSMSMLYTMEPLDREGVSNGLWVG
jgi:hypothetical protein